MLKSSTQNKKAGSTFRRSSDAPPLYKTFRPHGYQKEGIKWLLKKPRAGLFWDPGLGKTITVLSAFKILRDQGLAKRMLVLSKKRIVAMTWPEEIEGWHLPFTYAVATGSAGKRLAALESDADIVLMNNENVPWAGSSAKLRGLIQKFDVLVIDESSKYRSTKTQRYKALKKMLKYFKRRYILTGTPAPKGLLNLFPQMFIVDRGESLGTWITQFRNRYFVPHGYEGMKWVPRDDHAKDTIYDAIADKVLRASDKILNLPAIIPVNRVVKLSPEARRVYDEMENEFLIEWESRVVTAFNSGVKTQKLRQIANGAIYTSEDDGPRTTVEIHDAKVQELIDLYEESQGVPLLVNYEFDHDRERIQRAFAEHEDELDVPAIYGGTSDAQAQAYKDAWNRGELPILLSQGDTASHGLNMQKTRAHIVFFNVPWDLEVYIQFIRRVRRQGYVGGESVMVYHILVEDSVDFVALRGAELKDQEQNALFTALEERYGNRRKQVAKKSKKARELHTAEQIIPLKITIGNKRAMEVLCEHIEAQARKPPRLRLHEPNAVSDFVMAMYAELARWPIKHLGEFIRETTGEVPKELDVPSLLGESKRIFHEMFGHAEATDDDLKNPECVWKMWPHVRRKRNEAEDREEIEMQTQTETKSRRSKFSSAAPAKEEGKKASKKTAAPAEAPAPKKSAKKQEAAAAPKKAAKKSGGDGESTRMHLAEDVKIQFVKDPTKKGARQELADAAKAKSVKTVGHLIAKMAEAKWDERTTRNYMNKLVRGGCIKVLSQ